MSVNDTQALNLVNSRRLQALRERGTNANVDIAVATTSDATGSDAMQQFIALQIENVLAAMPVGKRKSLFKIRYGVTPDELRSQAPEQAAKILGISLSGVEKRRKWHQKT